MLITILTWVFIFLGILLLMLLVLPFRISLIGQADDSKGLSLEMKMDYAFGLIQVIAHNKESADIFILGSRIRRFSIETLKSDRLFLQDHENLKRPVQIYNKLHI